MPAWLRVRAPFIALAVGTIVLGLGVHASGRVFGPVARDILGDALWAMMMAWWVGALVPHGSLRARTTAALMVCVVVELSQLVHTPTLDSLRATRGGQLVLGSGFDPRDLLAYGLGVVGAAILEYTVRRRGTDAAPGGPRRAAI